MTEEQMDARLQAAGLAFRNDTATPTVVPDPFDQPVALITPIVANRRRPPVALILSAAVVVAAVIVGGLLAVRGFGGGGNDRAATGPSPQSQLQGHPWTLKTISEDTVNADGSGSGGGGGTQFSLQLTFDGQGKFSTTGCHAVSGTVSYDGPRLTFAPSAPQTCSPTPVGGTADEYSVNQVLAGAVTWSVRAGRLTLIKHLPLKQGETSNTITLSFDGPAVDRAPKPVTTVPAQLAGKTWTVSGYQHDTANSSSGGSASGGSITFTAGRYALQHECGVSTGAARFTRDHIALRAPTTSTDHSCPALTGAYEKVDELLQGLPGATIAWSVNGGQLTLTRGADSLTFTPSH